ncbi:MAG: two-component system response regulator CreB [Nitrospira sp.]|nr:two-component system response regulator CreB [Nitrospira sp.]
MSKTILVIEDESAIADNILFALKTEGYRSVWKQVGLEGVAVVRSEPVDLVILDVGLPDSSGFEICKAIRSFSPVPIVFLTARSEVVDRVVGLEIGADDYVVKPFSPRELVARVKVILKRVAPQEPAAMRVEGLFDIDEDKARIRYCRQLLTLTKHEYLLLKTLLSQPERVFTREQLMNLAWESPEASLDRTVDAHIKTIRAKLRTVNADYDPILTHRGMGYSIAPHHA